MFTVNLTFEMLQRTQAEELEKNKRKKKTIGRQLIFFFEKTTGKNPATNNNTLLIFFCPECRNVFFKDSSSPATNITKQTKHIC